MNRLMTAASVVVLVGACATTPPNELLNRAVVEYDSTQMMNGVNNAAASHVDKAKQSLDRARQLQEDGGDKNLVNHHALLAIKYSEIAKERLLIKNTQQMIEDSQQKRQQLLLSAREEELRTATTKALAAETRAEMAMAEAEAAKQKLQQAKAEAEMLADKLTELKAKQSERGIVLTLEDIVFAYNSDQLQRGGERTIGRIAEFLQQYDKRKVLIEGHTDSRGSDSYNLQLSERRAAAVKRSLVAAGVSEDRISTSGLGEQYPVATNDSDEGRAKNRRVELIISNTDDKEVQAR